MKDNKVYLHVSNGGAKFYVEQTENGAEFTIETNGFENCVSTQKITTDNKGIKALSDMFLEATKIDFNVNRSYALAKVLGSSREFVSSGDQDVMGVD